MFCVSCEHPWVSRANHWLTSRPVDPHIPCSSPLFVGHHDDDADDDDADGLMMVMVMVMTITAYQNKTRLRPISVYLLTSLHWWILFTEQAIWPIYPTTRMRNSSSLSSSSSVTEILISRLGDSGFPDWEFSGLRIPPQPIRLKAPRSRSLEDPLTSNTDITPVSFPPRGRHILACFCSHFFSPLLAHCLTSRLVGQTFDPSQVHPPGDAQPLIHCYNSC